MGNSNKQLGREVCARRISRRLSQTDLGDSVGISQTAISRIEKGDIASVSPEKLSALLKLLELQRFSTGGSDMEEDVLACCSNADCPEGFAFINGQKLATRPKYYLIRASETRFCRACGGALITHCRLPTCGKPLTENAAYCTFCGEPYVEHEVAEDIISLWRSRKAERDAYSNCAPTEALPSEQEKRVGCEPTGRLTGER